MKTKQIIEEMEKEFDDKFKSREGEETAYAQGWILLPDDIKSFISSYTRTLLESFGEEIIGEDDAIPSEYVPGFEVDSIRDELRAEQRLKVKEILQNIT